MLFKAMRTDEAYVVNVYSDVTSLTTNYLTFNCTEYLFRYGARMRQYCRSNLMIELFLFHKEVT